MNFFALIAVYIFINILHLEFILFIKNIYFLASSFKLQVSKVVRKVFKLENFEIRITLAQVLYTVTKIFWAIEYKWILMD